MAVLTDYLDARTLRQLQDSFSAAAGASIRILGPSGEPLAQQGAPAPAAASDADVQVPVLIDGQKVGRLELAATGAIEPRAWAQGLLGLMADVVSRLWDRDRQLRARVDELATLYRLTAEFTEQRDLQAILDLVARTVVEVLKAKACSIRLLNEEKTELVMSAVANLSPEYLNKGPILVSASTIDQEVLSSLKTVHIADERTDPRVLYPAEARREGIVSALCAPLVYKGGREGVIHVYTAELHEFDWFEASLLDAVAGQAAAAIVNARLYAEAVSSANMRRALAMAAEVQGRMIPAALPGIPGFQIGAVYVPTFELGGDFYDFIELPEGNVGLAVCDVVGKGVRASLLMASIRAALRAHAASVYEMSEVLARVNRSLCADTLSSDFATLFYAVITIKSRRLTYANAGHVPPLLFRDGGSRNLTVGGGVIGIDPSFTWQHDSFRLEAGDVVLAYTDGLSEAMNFKDEPFGRHRVEQAAQAAIADGRDAAGIVKHVLWEMRRFAGLQTRADDLTIVAIKAE